MKMLGIGDTDGGRMRREARVLARIEHPGIVPIHDVGTLEDGRVYYTMKLVPARGWMLIAARRALCRIRCVCFNASASRLPSRIRRVLCIAA